MHGLRYEVFWCPSVSPARIEHLARDHQPTNEQKRRPRSSLGEVEESHELLGVQFAGRRPLPRTTPYMDHAHDSCSVIHGEEDSIHMRPASVAERSNGMVRIEALRRNRTSLGMLIEGEDYALEAVEPLGALLRRPSDDPQVQFLEIAFGTPRDLNAVCHAYGAGEQRSGEPAWCVRP